jgi:hypothetical protein
LAPCFYQPLYYLPFGHSDTVAIVLADTFDVVSQLTAELRTSVEGIDFGFCPTLDSFAPRNEQSPLVDLGTWLSEGPSGVQGDPRSRLGEAGGFHEHPFQQLLPLSVLVKLKMDWWGTVGFSMLFEQFLFRAIHRRVRSTLRDLEQLCDGEKQCRLFDRDDVTSLRYAVIDLQGEEELAVILFCRNYSVAMSAIASLRCLTLGDILAEDTNKDLDRAIRQSPAHTAIWTLYRWLRKEDRSPAKTRDPCDLERIRGNHVFRWTHSLLAVAPSALFADAHENCQGQVEAMGQFRVAPGHEWTTGHLVRKSPGVPKGGPVQGSDGEFGYCAGMVDLMIRYQEDQTSGRGGTLSLCSALSIIRENLKTFGGAPLAENGLEVPPMSARDVVDCASCFTIPVPSLEVFKQEPQNHEPLLLTILPELQRVFFYPEDDGLGHAEAENEMDPRHMDLKVLALSMEKSGVPAELRRSVLFVYRDFATFLADPFLFDAVLDLYDVFATLYATLTVHIPRYRARELLRSRHEWLPSLDSARVDIVTQMVQGLHNALVHRVGRMYPESPIRQMSIDFRGGLTQVILAANAPLVCGLGLLRKYVIGIGPHGSSRRTVGGLTSVSLDPGTRACWFNLGPQNPVQLALIEADILHVLHPASYVDYLHECAHLIYRSLTSQQMVGLRLASIPSPQTADRVQEVFANLVTYLILYAGDADVFLYNQLLNYVQRQCSRSSDDIEPIVLLSEFLIRLFLVTDCVEPGTSRSAWLETSWRREGAAMSEVTASFRRFLVKASPFLPHHEALWRDEGSRGWQHCMRQLQHIFPKLAPYMPEIWAHAIYVFREFYCRDLHGRDGLDPQVALYPLVCAALREGRPLVRCLYRGEDGTQGDSDMTAMDPLALGCAVLYQYVSRIKEAEGKEVYLRRDKDGRVCYAGSDKVWYDFQLEIGAASMFCPVPLERSERLKREIVVLKTFWDIAANLRARRLREIIDFVDPRPRTVREEPRASSAQ